MKSVSAGSHRSRRHLLKQEFLEKRWDIARSGTTTTNRIIGTTRTIDWDWLHWHAITASCMENVTAEGRASEVRTGFLADDSQVLCEHQLPDLVTESRRELSSLSYYGLARKSVSLKLFIQKLHRGETSQAPRFRS